MKPVRHKTESIYSRYVIDSESDLSEGVEKLAIPDINNRFFPPVNWQSYNARDDIAQFFYDYSEPLLLTTNRYTTH
jgi:hypothetical protein